MCFQEEEGIQDCYLYHGLGDVYKRKVLGTYTASVSVLPPPQEINTKAKKLNAKILFIIQLKKKSFQNIERTQS